MRGPSEVNLTVNTTARITVFAEDPNEDPITFNVTGSLPKGAQISTVVYQYQISRRLSYSVTLTWTVTTQQVTETK